jgi:hypothetical protein
LTSHGRRAHRSQKLAGEASVIDPPGQYRIVYAVDDVRRIVES